MILHSTKERYFFTHPVGEHGLSEFGRLFDPGQSLICVFCFPPGLVTTDSLAWGLPVKRDSEREGSCSQSTIQQNVTLKGGIRAGYFRKLAQYVAMQLCVDLCCEEKGCDVAFMSGKNCFGVQCFSEDQCQTIPAKKPAPEPIYISQVTIKGEGGMYEINIFLITIFCIILYNLEAKVQYTHKLFITTFCEEQGTFQIILCWVPGLIC